MQQIEPSAYLAAPPSRIAYIDALKNNLLKKLLSKFCYYITLVTGIYTNLPKNPTELTSSNPAGEITKEQLALCQDIYDEVKERDEKLAQKTSFTLSSIAIIAPLTISAAIYIKTTVVLTTWYNGIIVAFITLSLFFLFLAFIAAFRASFIRSYDSLFIPAIIDIPNKSIKKYSIDMHGRGLLWCAANHTAMNDHKTDFVKASHLFITLSVLFLIASATPLIYTLSPDAKIQNVKGEMLVTSKSIESSMSDIKNEIKMFRVNPNENARLKLQIDQLNKRIEIIEKNTAQASK